MRERRHERGKLHVHAISPGPALSSRRQSIRRARQHHRRRRIRASCTTDIALPGSSRATRSSALGRSPRNRLAAADGDTGVACARCFSCQQQCTRRCGAGGLHRSTEACPFVPTSGRSLIGAKPTLKQLSPRPTNDRRLKDFAGLVPHSDGLFVALSLRGGRNERPWRSLWARITCVRGSSHEPDLWTGTGTAR